MVKMLIDGALVDGERQMDVIDPTDESIVAQVPDAGVREIGRASCRERV